MGASEVSMDCYDDPSPVRKARRRVICGYRLRPSAELGGTLPARVDSFHGEVPTRVETGAGEDDLRRVAATLALGDVLLVPGLDHLRMSMWRVMTLLDGLRARGVEFVASEEGIDTREPGAWAALSVMRHMLDAERRLMARRAAEARVPVVEAPVDPVLERSRRIAAPWIDEVRENRPRMTWDDLVARVVERGRGVDVTASIMRRHVRRLVAAGDLPESVLAPTPRGIDDASARAAVRAREISAAEPTASLRDIAERLEAEGVLPPRAEAWSAQTVKRLLG